MNAPCDQFLAMTDEKKRKEYALEIKREGRPIIGYLDPYIPEEIIYAADMFPWHIRGTQDAATPLASVYRPRYTSLHCLHVLEALLRGDLDFLDGIIMTDWDDDHKRLWDQIRFVVKMPFTPMIHVPQVKSPQAIGFFAKTLHRLREQIEKHFDVEIPDEKLQKSIDLVNETRDLLTKFYELKKSRPQLFSGAVTFGIVNAAITMPKIQFNSLMVELLGSATKMENAFKPAQYKLLLTSDWLDGVSYINLIESTGATIAMDDLNLGTRYFWRRVEIKPDPIRSLAERYLMKPPCPRMAFWNEQVAQIRKWVKQYKVDGVINLPEIYSWPRRFFSCYLRDNLTKNGIPTTTIIREYHLSNVGQIRTRLEAFLETLGK